MDSEVYKFNKTFEERLENLNNILCDVEDHSLPQINRIWSNYLELSIEPVGWKALWYISRRCCNELKITFPAIVVVTVEFIDFNELTANVTVVEVEDIEESNKIPAKVNDVPLKELYITINQVYEGPDFSITAECLDNFRFFYNHLWWPWDEDDSKTENWVDSHFLFRLKLFYDMLNGNMHYVTAKTIKQLIEKGKELFNKIEDLQNEFDPANSDQEMKNEDVVQLIELTEELDSVKKKLSHWENPDLRKSLNLGIEKKYSTKGIIVVVPECSVKDAREYFDQALKSSTETELYKRSTNTMNEALLQYIRGDTIIVTPCIQSVSGNEHLGHNVTIRGLSSTDSMPKITDARSHWCLFESIGENVVMNNLIIEVQSSRAALAVKGTTFLDSVTFKNTNTSSMSAIIVHSKGTLIATKCNFKDFNVAILCMKGATAHLMNCTFLNNDVCIKVENGSEMVVDDCDLSKTNDIPIQFKGDSTTNKCRTSMDFFNSVEGIALNSIKVADLQKVVQVM